MNSSKHLLVTGFMGAGKTRVSKAIAKLTNIPFVDLDNEIISEAGKSIPQIFKDQGEDTFRKTEANLLHTLLSQNPKIISLGGGTLHNPHINKDLIKKSTTVFINTPIETILNRLEGNTKRPLLLNRDGSPKTRSELKSLIEALFEKRKDVYFSSDIIYTPKLNQTSESVAKELVKLLDRNGQ